MFEVVTRDWQGKITGTVRVTQDGLLSILNSLGPMDTATVSRVDETLEQLAMGRKRTGGGSPAMQMH